MSMKIIQGISASPGIAIGRVFIHQDDTAKVPRYTIERDGVGTEFLRFTDAINRAIKEIEEIKSYTGKNLHPDEINMLDTHLLMLSDPDFSGKVEKGLSDNLENVEYVISAIMQDLISKLGQVKDEYLRERTADFHDVGKRVLNQLMNTGRRSLSHLKEDVLLVCQDLLPSDAIAMDKLRVKGIAMEGGGKTSHTAILARAFEIPAVLGISDLLGQVSDGELLIIDGYKGQVFLSPDKELVEQYTVRQKARQKREVQLLQLNELPAETRDGKVILLNANIEIPEEVDAVIAHGADGIGLFRSEFLFLRDNELPDEQAQFEAYRKVLKAMGRKQVTIRTLDIGGDKLLKNMKGMHTPGVGEKNPLLGWRAIRFCLSHLDIFKTQLRAMMRASVHGNLKIMFPLISGLQELESAMVILEEVKSELRGAKIPFDESVSVGIMIEVPSAALITDILAKKSAFFSIGTNDLIQYTMAVDRGNEHIAYLYDPLHPGVLRFLKMIIENAHKAGIPVCMCGEMAGDPFYTLVLLGLGLDEFSMSSFGIPEVKRIIRSTSMAEAEEFVGQLMDMSSSAGIASFTRSFMEERFEIADD